MSGSTKTSALSKRSTISVLREGFRKKFALNKRKSTALSPQQGQGQGQGLLARRFGAASSKEQKYRYVCGWSSLYYQCEDRLCNKYYLSDANGARVGKPPGKTCGVVVLSQDAIDSRTDLLKQGLADRACEAVQLQILNENESIHLARMDAASLGARQVAGEDIHTIQDVLRVVNMSHHARTFQREGVDLATAFFLKDEDMEELGLKTGERIRLQLVLDYMRHVKVEMAVDSLAKMRTTRFIKGDQVEHLKESENLIRKGKIVGVHADDAASGVYYTVALDSERGYELQSAERKLEFPGVWEKVLRDQGIEPIFTEPGMEEEETPLYAALDIALPLTPVSAPPQASGGEYDKYSRMKRAGLPEAAVINAMQRDGVPVPLGFFAEPASGYAPPPSPPSFMDETTDPFSFATMDEEEPVMTMEDDSSPRRSSLLSGMAPPPPVPPIPPYRSNAASLSELEILKAIDEQLTLEDSLNESMEFHRLRRMSSSITGLPPPPPAPHNDYFDDGMRLASIEPAIEEEDEFELSGMTAPPPPIPSQRHSLPNAETAAGSAQWEDDISFLNQSNLMPTMHEEPFDFEEEEEYMVQ